MLLIAITNWRRKLGLICRLILFLVLIGLIVPQFLSFIIGGIANFQNQTEGKHPPALRVEQETPGDAEEQRSGQGDSFLKKLRQFYYGKEPDLKPGSH
ncbi:MAG: hypothetical protein QHH75_00230 [Bacillota bacterium]|jgi:hypothetical protein|nr:hypothetical protein [Bacillota bacterium]